MEPRHLAEVWQLPFQLLCSESVINRIAIWLPVAHWPEIKNWQLDCYCRLTFHLLISTNASDQIGIWLLVINSLYFQNGLLLLFTIYALKL